MSLEDWLDRESRRHYLHIELAGLRRIDVLERRDDKSMVQSCRASATGKFRSKLLADSFTAGESGSAVTSLPLNVDLKFLEQDALEKLEAYGALQYYGATKTSDGVVDDPEQLILTLLLPMSLLDRFERNPIVPQLHICVSGVQTTEKGAVPGLSKKVWKDPEKSPLYVSEVTLFDPEIEDDAENSTPPAAVVPAPIVQIAPEFERRLFVWLGGIAALLFLILLFAKP